MWDTVPEAEEQEEARRHMKALGQLLRDKGFRQRFADVLMRYALSVQIQGLREEAGWTVEELAQRLGVTPTLVMGWERPGCRGITLHHLKRLAHLFDVGLIVRFTELSELIERALGDINSVSPPTSFGAEQAERANG